MEVYVKVPAAAFQREILQMFREGKEEKVVLVVVLQDSRCSLIEYSAQVQKDECLERFFEFARNLEENLEGFWNEFFDPASGLPMIQDSCIGFSDLEACIRGLKMESLCVGGCAMVRHKVFGFAVYPSTFVTSAPIDIVKEAVEKVRQKMQYAVIY
jgi:hypothetical protein